MTETTTDHETIRRWAESKGGKPAAVDRTHKGGDVGIVRIMFPQAQQSEHESLVEISWDEFFRAFDANGLAFLYQDDPESRFSKLVDRESIRARPRRPAASRPASSRSKSGRSSSSRSAPARSRSSRPPKSPRGRSRRTSH